MPRYQLKPSDGRKLNFSIKEHRAMVGKLNVILKDVKEHDSTLFQSNGLALKQGEEFAHSFNVKQIKCLEAKLTRVTQDMDALELIRRAIITAYSRAYSNSTSTKGEGKKKTAESQMKERGSGLKTTSNVFMESVLETR